MGVVVTLALIALVLVGIPIGASRGESRRGAYLAVAVVFAALTFGCYEMMNTPNTLATTEQERLGQELMDKVSGPVFLIYAAGLIGSLIGAAIFREAGSRTRTCPHCAESIQAAAVVCRFCGRDVAPLAVSPTLPTPLVQRSRKTQAAIATIGVGAIAVFLVVLRSANRGTAIDFVNHLDVVGDRYVDGIEVTNTNVGELTGCDITTRIDSADWYADISKEPIGSFKSVRVPWEAFKNSVSTLPAALATRARVFEVSCRDGANRRKTAKLQP